MVRDEKGRFGKDNGGGPGRPPKVAEQKVKAALRKAIPDSEFIAILAEQVRQGKDWAVIRWADYILGKPLQTTEVTGKDGGNIVIKVTRTHNGD